MDSELLEILTEVAEKLTEKGVTPEQLKEALKHIL
jgi:hypothetical protein